MQAKTHFLTQFPKKRHTMNKEMKKYLHKMEDKRTRILISISAVCLLLILVSALTFPYRDKILRTFFGKSPSKAAINDVPYLERVELAFGQGAGDGQGNGWGPHSNRIVRASNGDIYTTVTVPDPTQPSNIYAKYWKITKRDASTGQWATYLPSGADGKNVFTPPNILRGPQDQIYVISTPNMVPKMWNSVTSSEITVPPPSNGWYVNPRLQTGTQENTHLATGMNTNGQVFLTKYRSNGCAGAEIPGAYQLAFLDPNSNQWTSRDNFVFPGDQDNSLCNTTLPSFEHGRYEYQYLVPQAGSQMEMVGSLDLTSTQYGYPRANNNVDYYFNGVGIFNLSNPGSQPPAPMLLPAGGFTPTVYHLDGSNDTNIRFDARDVYVDNQNRTHIIYDLNYTGVYSARHAVIQNGAVVKDVPTNLNYGDKAKIIQDTQGNFFVFSVGPGADGTSCTLYMRKGAAGDTDGTNLDPVQTMELKTSSGQTFNCATIQNHYIAAPRSGTQLADYVDGAVAANYGIDWVYYRLQLHGGTATPTTAATVTPAGTVSNSSTRSTGQITAKTVNGVTSYNAGDTFDVLIEAKANEQFKSAGATITVSPNLSVQSISAPPAAYGPCNFSSYTTTATTSNPSFAGSYNSGLSSTSCTVYVMTVKALSNGSGMVTVSNGQMTASSDSAAIFSQANSGTFTIGSGSGGGTIQLSPSSGSQNSGSQFTVDVVVDGGAILLIVLYQPEKLDTADFMFQQRIAKVKKVIKPLIFV
jgi:hypothetical protein